MKPRPAHLEAAYAAQFGDPSVVAHYHHRPPYPDETFDLLDRLLDDRPRIILDIGTGTGEIARRMSPRVEHVDAVDVAPAMIEMARSMPGGESPRIRWIAAAVETVALGGPYGLVTAGASLHWMDWHVVLPRLRDALVPGGLLACLDTVQLNLPWQHDLTPILARHSTNREFRPYHVIDEIEQRGLFRTLGQATTAPVALTQSVEDYVASFHARNGFSLDRMKPEPAAAFDREVTALVAPHARSGQVTLTTASHVTWGCPLAPA